MKYLMDLGSGIDPGVTVNESHLDSHADTCAGGANFALLDPQQIDGYVDVAPFSDEYQPLPDVPVATCVTAWTCPQSGAVYILVFGQMLFFGEKLSHSLLCPNQMRANGIQVQDTPTQFDSKSNHHIIVPTDDDNTDVVIPLEMKGVVSIFESRIPTKEELESCDYLMMTSEKCWDPHSLQFQERESAAKFARSFSYLESEHHFRRLQSVSTRVLAECSIAEDQVYLSGRLDGTNSGDKSELRIANPKVTVSCLH